MSRRAKPRTSAVKSLGPSNDDSPELQVEMRAARQLGDPRSPLPDVWDTGGGSLAFGASARLPDTWAWDISRPIAVQLAETAASEREAGALGALLDEIYKPAETAADDAEADAIVRCDWHSEHDADGRPTGQRCGDQATHRLVWLDGSNRYSYGCDAHLGLEPGAPAVRIESIQSNNPAGAP